MVNGDYDEYEVSGLRLIGVTRGCKVWARAFRMVTFGFSDGMCRVGKEGSVVLQKKAGIPT